MPVPVETVPSLLNPALRTLLTAEELRWLDTVHASAIDGSAHDVLRAYTGAAVLRPRAFELTADARASLASLAPGLSFETWTVADAARALLLLRRAEVLGAEACAGAAVACYEQGDAAEHQSWLRAISLLPVPSQFTPLAIDACRTNIQPVFQALACENPFPAAHFPERNFNQMVLKALFNDVALHRIVGLSGRINRELARMAGDYAAERRAAGRSVPSDIGQVL
jgi:hypothetical protein